MTIKKRNPQDATLRNIRALKARVTKLEQFVKRLTAPSKAMRRHAAIHRKYERAWKNPE